MSQALMPVNQGRKALVAAASMDGLAGAAIWAAVAGPLDLMLFTTEGLTGRIFQTPSLMTAPQISELYCYAMPLIKSDLDFIQPVAQQTGLIRMIWLDHHHMHVESESRLRSWGVQVINDPSYDSSCSLLMNYQPPADAWARELCQALQIGPGLAGEPWRSWLLVFLAVQSDLFGIRTALQPLIEGRFQSFDSGLRQAGLALWNDLCAKAEGPLHEFQVGARRVMILGVSAADRINYRLLVDRVMNQRNIDLGLLFFDDLERFVCYSNPVGPQAVDLWSFGDQLAQAGHKVYYYDRRTIYLEPTPGNKLAALERTIEAISGLLS